MLHGTEYQHTHFTLLQFQANNTIRKLPHSFWLCVLLESSLLHGTEYLHTHFTLLQFQANNTIRKMSHSFWLVVLLQSSLLHGTEYQHTHFVLSHFQATCTVRKLSRSFWFCVLSISSRLPPYGTPDHAFCIVAFPSNLHGKETVTLIWAFRTFRKQPAAR